VALVGQPNAGKSSLFNALAGVPAAIVSPVPGTTRDYVTRSVAIQETNVELIDTAGWQAGNGLIEERAQRLGREQASRANLRLWCVPQDESVGDAPSGEILLVRTKIDDPNDEVHGIATSAHTGRGVAELRRLLADRARHVRAPALAPSLSRCAHHVEKGLSHLRAAHRAVLFDEPSELLALELRLALDQLGEMVGAVYTDDLLDRIFSRFCIGK
jgi:tRNA modification GTPase